MSGDNNETGKTPTIQDLEQIIGYGKIDVTGTGLDGDMNLYASFSNKEEEKVDEEEGLSLDNAVKRVIVLKKILTAARSAELTAEDIIENFAEEFPEFSELLKNRAEEDPSLTEDFKGKTEGNEERPQYSSLVRAASRLDQIAITIQQEINNEENPNLSIEGRYQVIFPEFEHLYKPMSPREMDDALLKIADIVAPDDGTIETMTRRKAVISGQAITNTKEDEELNREKLKDQTEKYDRREKLLRENLLPALEKLAAEFKSNKETFGIGCTVELVRDGQDRSPAIQIGLGPEGLGGDGGNWQQQSRIRIMGRGGREIFGIKEEKYVRASSMPASSPKAWSWQRVNTTGSGKDVVHNPVYKGHMNNFIKVNPSGYELGATAEEIVEIVKQRYSEALFDAKKGYEQRLTEQRGTRLRVGASIVAALAFASWATDYDDKAIDWIKTHPPVSWLVGQSEVKTGYGEYFDTDEGIVFTTAPESNDNTFEDETPEV